MFIVITQKKRHSEHFLFNPSPIANHIHLMTHTCIYLLYTSIYKLLKTMELAACVNCLLIINQQPGILIITKPNKKYVLIQECKLIKIAI